MLHFEPSCFQLWNLGWCYPDEPETYFDAWVGHDLVRGAFYHENLFFGTMMKHPNKITKLIPSIFSKIECLTKII